MITKHQLWAINPRNWKKSKETDREDWDNVLKAFYQEEREAIATYKRPPIFDVWLVNNYYAPKQKKV